MQSANLGATWADAFSGLVQQAADVYKQRTEAKAAQAALDAQRRFELAQSFPQTMVSQTPGGGFGLVLGLGLVAFLMLSRKGRR